MKKVSFFFNMMSTLEHLITNDGSSTLKSKVFNSFYHSVHGAIQESNHVFIAAGLEMSLKQWNTLSVFELGFGTGLNALLSAIWAEQSKATIFYDSIDLIPVEDNVWNELNYTKILIHPDSTDYFKKMHTCPWNRPSFIHSHFTLCKIKANWLNYQPTSAYYNLFYMDAFGPESQAELWKIESLHKIWSMLKPEGIMVSYCAKGQFKRDLKSLGFKIESLPGPPGKREMTRAIKCS